MATLCRSKLWHPLTMAVLEFLLQPNNLRSEEGNSFLALYDRLVLRVEKKLNPLSLARIASAVADSLLPSDGTAAKAVLENLLEKKARLGVPATLYLESKLHLLTLTIVEKDHAGDGDLATLLRPVQESLKQNASRLGELAVDPSTTLVHSAHYECSMKYRKAVGPPEAFYQEALRYLNYTPLEDVEDPQTLAMDLSLAALTGDGVFGFGQVVSAPLLQVLRQNPSQSWWVDLLDTLATGDVAAFGHLTKEHEAEMEAQPALVHRAHVVQEKITLLALVNMVFERSSAERTLTFEEIAERIQKETKDVEGVMMRALSLKLMEGWIDQVSQQVHVTWVMPRVLTQDQRKELASRFGEWAVKVSKTKDYMDEHTPSLFA
eukprot:CAMPEP_0116846240 /NCGR_PEP_ID=MMETSP0418-20121206/13723_1 /TAXON_ID=1158023 /ORGANISM="Astrosyne radiata, Strain 13vi08-1A" /LENGTH=376 /DNA_ID=CAMNT_0004477461 /DNA_START=16 /DNA_END=1146 /DNA_ORIENTATION=+